MALVFPVRCSGRLMVYCIIVDRENKQILRLASQLPTEGRLKKCLTQDCARHLSFRCVERLALGGSADV
jgi:hypothetical protein